MATAADQSTPLQPTVLLLQPLVLAAAVECIGRFFQHQGLPRLARACHAEASGKRGSRLSQAADFASPACQTAASHAHPTPPAHERPSRTRPFAAWCAEAATTVPASGVGEGDQAAAELIHLAHNLLDIIQSSPAPCATCRRLTPLVKSAQTSTGLPEPSLTLSLQSRSPLTISHEALSFLWPLLSPFIEKPSGVAALAVLARLPSQALQDDGQRLCVGHANLHPNSLGPNEEVCSAGLEIGPRSYGILNRLSFHSLVSTQFHLPRQEEAFWLLELLTASPCHSLRKLVDRQSRWRPREQRFEALDEAGLRRAAALAEKLGGLRSLRHFEGPIFSIILRARGQQVAKQQAEAHAAYEAAAAATGDAWLARQHAQQLVRPHAWLEDAGRNGAGAAKPQYRPGSSLADKLEVAYLMDTSKEDLLGFWEPLYPKLQKLVLLNLPTTSPGITARAVAAFLPKVPNLTELQLDFGFFDPASWELSALELLVERVQNEPSKVSKFLLEWCRLGDAGVRTVCETFMRHPAGAVTELSLAHCEMRDVTTVCEMLETPDLSLTKLDLSSNTLDDCQAARLAKALPLSQVKELRLRDSQISVPLPVKTEWFWGC